METRKLYYEDCHLSRFRATVLTCRQERGDWLVELDATAFYPEGGGQAADTGTLGPVRVKHTREEGARVIHLCDGPLTPGDTVEGVIDYAARFHRMQQHTGEHMVSGLIHSRYGWHNTGFHMGAEGITIDFDGVIPPEDLPGLEAAANHALWQNLPVRCFTPDPEALEATVYRTKRALPWPVRIVQVPGIDSCACCGVHCASTGEVGLIKLFSSIPFRGGSRLLMACGSHALSILNDAWQQNKLVSQAFSAKPGQTGEAAARVNQELEDRKYRITALERRLWTLTARSYAGSRNILHFEEPLSGTALRELTDALADSCSGIAAVFAGSDETGYSFCLASREQDLTALGRKMTQTLTGRGGGKPHFQQGSVKATKEAIEGFFREKFQDL